MEMFSLDGLEVLMMSIEVGQCKEVAVQRNGVIKKCLIR